MVGYGLYLDTNAVPGWKAHYMRYNELKDMFEAQGQLFKEETAFVAKVIAASPRPFRVRRVSDRLTDTPLVAMGRAFIPHIDLSRTSWRIRPRQKSASGATTVAPK